MKPSKIILALTSLLAINQPTMMWGPPGAGKSDLVRLLGKKTERRVFDIRLALLDPTDLRGIPFFNPDKKTAEWAEPSMLPHPEDGPSILFLDEINAAPPSIQAAAYQLVLDRCIGDYKLPDDCYIVAAGNRESDKGVTHTMPTPLMNRFTHIEFDVNADDWVEWAMENQVHSDIVGFISYSKGNLHKFNANNLNERGFPTPRSWVFSSNIIKQFDEHDPENVSIMKELINGTIGEGMSIEFFAHRDVNAYLPHPKSILQGKVMDLDPMVKEEMSAHYTIIVSMIYELSASLKDKNPKIEEEASNFLKFMDKNFTPEFNVFGFNMAGKAGDIPFRQCKYMNEFLGKYAKYITP